MEQLQALMSQWMTPESFKPLMAFAGIWMAWKLVSKTWGMTVAVVKKLSFIGLTTGTMAILGTGVAGFGFGEVGRSSHIKPSAVVDAPPDRTGSIGLALAGAGIASTITSVVAFSHRKPSYRS